MNTQNNTILVTGGSAGIGLEIAKQFTAAGNKVIITGRTKERLDKALAQLPGATGIISDVSKKEDTDALVATLTKDFPALNIVVNNAGHALLHDLSKGENSADKAAEEILTNYISIIRLNEKLLPVLSKHAEAAIVNVSSVVAFVPGALSTYSASKAALHSYTQSLRISLARAGNIKVFELMPPLVNTDFSAPIGGQNGIAPEVVAADLLNGLKNNIYEIRTGNTQKIYDLYLQSPAAALEAMQPA
ncbi:SDR family oxidoreductase [Ferruginibacter sp.]